MPIFLRGLVEKAFGSFVSIRGYATLEELAQSSKAPRFQRKLIPEHAKEIEKYIEAGNYLFFPEVVLSYSLREKYTKTPLKKITDGKYRYASSSLVITARERIYYKTGGEVQRVTVKMNEGRKPLLRIDGNHRLRANVDKSLFDGHLIPFCLVLFNEEDGLGNSKAIFHNINYKARPLTSEENLKGIIDDEDLYPNKVLQSPSFGREYYYTRRFLFDYVDDDLIKNIPFLRPSENLKCRTALLELFEYLLKNKVMTRRRLPYGFDVVRDTVLDVDKSYESDLKKSKSIGLFIACVYFKLRKPEIFSLFIKWVKSNNLFELDEIKAESLIKIFKKVQESKKRRVFVSMPFGVDVNEAHFRNIKTAVDEINKDMELSKRIDIVPVRIDKSEEPCTFQITDKILESIESSGLFVADLTGMNPNVYHEVGYAMGLCKSKGLEDNIILILREGNHDCFNLRNFSQIRFKEVDELKNELKKKIKTFYNLDDE